MGKKCQPTMFKILKIFFLTITTTIIMKHSRTNDFSLLVYVCSLVLFFPSFFVLFLAYKEDSYFYLYLNPFKKGYSLHFIRLFFSAIGEVG